MRSVGAVIEAAAARDAESRGGLPGFPPKDFRIDDESYVDWHETDAVHAALMKIAEASPALSSIRRWADSALEFAQRRVEVSASEKRNAGDVGRQV
jgi:hypothetical protein